jgi:osmotically-inducible protein OsmY
MPKTYDEIVRKTVPLPDSSIRPSPEQVRQAYEGFRALDADEQALKDRVEAALGAHPNVEVEVQRDRVILRGKVSGPEELRQVPELVRGIEGVGAVDDQLVIG